MRPKLPTHQVWENVLLTLLKNIVYNRRHKYVSDPPLSHFITLEGIEKIKNRTNDNKTV